MSKERTGDYRPHSETDAMTNMTPSDAMNMFQSAQSLHERGRHGCALIILKVLDRCLAILPQGFSELRASVHAQIGIS